MKLNSISWVSNLIGISYNQPVLSPNARWDTNGVTFADKAVIGAILIEPKPIGLFVDRNDTIYAIDRTKGQVHAWHNGSMTMRRTSSTILPSAATLFVTMNGDIYISGETSVEKSTLNATKSMVVMNVSNFCSGLFVDTANYLYCSLENEHRVVVQSLNDDVNSALKVVGNGMPGSDSYTLNSPRGIFVDINFDLYVADCNNNRIQRFQFGQLSGTTVPEDFEAPPDRLNCPTAVFLDADKSLFIVDGKNNRIVRSNSDRFDCLVGCSNDNGAASSQLSFPTTAAFDSHGNIFVADTNNNRIQVFGRMKNMSGEYVN